MKQFLIRQAIYVPLVYFGFIFLAGFFANNYSHLQMHASMLGINDAAAAKALFQAGIVLTSISLFGLSVGLLLNYKKQFALFALFTFLFGVTFIFGAIFPITSPWHGFFAFGLFIMMVPFMFLYELQQLSSHKMLHRLSIAAGLLMFLYLWLMITGFDPAAYRGLTQRVFGLVVFGWYALVAWHLYRDVKTQ